MSDDYKQFFVRGEIGHNLRPCPCCGTAPTVINDGDSVRIICPKDGCHDVDGRTMEDAVKLWNEPTFRDAMFEAK